MVYIGNIGYIRWFSNLALNLKQHKTCSQKAKFGIRIQLETLINT